MLMYTLLCIVLISSSAIYVVEPRSNVGSLPRAVWLSIVTMTTVGYGDVTPTTPLGYTFVSMLVLTSMLFMAMPLGIIGSAFNETWKAKDRVLLISRTRAALDKWGYTAKDIMALFRMVDRDSDGELELDEFLVLIKQMKIGLQSDRALQLFESMDADGSGAIDAREFVRHVYPKSYVELYGHLSANSDAHDNHWDQEEHHVKESTFASSQVASFMTQKSGVFDNRTTTLSTEETIQDLR